jgi:hypothetical protein
MDSITRRKLSMARLALTFEHKHPSTDPSHQAVVTRLEALVGRIDAVFTQQELGTVGERAAAARRRTVRRTLRMRLKHLARVGAIAALETPALTGKFIPPMASGPNRVFVGTAKAMQREATTHHDLLLAAGLGADFLQRFDTAIADFEAAAAAASEGRLDHIAARADFERLGKECLAMVKLLDGLNEARFEKEPEQLAAWQSARNVFGPFTRLRGETETPMGLLPPGV